jgi:hypothetical protein
MKFGGDITSVAALTLPVGSDGRKVGDFLGQGGSGRGQKIKMG